MNVILITLDACRLDHMNFAGYIRNTTPNLNKIAEEMALFLNNYVDIPMSDPAIVSVLTGLYAHTHGVRSLGAKKQINRKTLHGILQHHNYRTACMSIEQNDNVAIREGFDEFNKLNWRIKSKIKRVIVKTFDWGKKYGAAEVVTDNAINWIKKNEHKNFFLYMHYMDLHWPYAPPPPYDNIFEPDYKGSHRFNDLDNGKIKKGANSYNNQLTEEERNHAISHYDGCILYTDSQLGRLIHFLKDKNIWEDSIIIITGDHGEHLGENNIYYAHGASLYQPSIKVPLLFKAPQINNKRILALSQPTDIMPTVLEILNIPMETPVEGKSLVPLITGNKEKVRDYAFAEAGYCYVKQFKKWYVEGIEGKWKMVTDGKWKLIFIPHPENDIYELYNLEEDPNETRNLIEKELIEQENKIFENLKQRVHSWINQKGFEEKGEEPVYTEKEEKKVKERLMRLGYLD